MRHFVIVAVLVLVVAALTYMGLNAAGLMPVEASAQAVSIDWLWNLEIITISFLFSLIVVPLFYSLVVFRRRKGETGDGEYIEGSTKLEVTWTIIPLAEDNTPTLTKFTSSESSIVVIMLGSGKGVILFAPPLVGV